MTKLKQQRNELSFGRCCRSPLTYVQPVRVHVDKRRGAADTLRAQCSRELSAVAVDCYRHRYPCLNLKLKHLNYSKLRSVATTYSKLLACNKVQHCSLARGRATINAIKIVIISKILEEVSTIEAMSLQ